jgi:hypothetical protein
MVGQFHPEHEAALRHTDRGLLSVGTRTHAAGERSRNVLSRRSTSIPVTGSDGTSIRLNPRLSHSCNNDYRRVLPLVETTPFNVLMARAVLDGHERGTVWVDSLSPPRACYIRHQYGMSYLLGHTEDSVFRTELSRYCLDTGLQPVWSCRTENTSSYHLANTLGFQESARRPFYQLPAGANGSPEIIAPRRKSYYDNRLP